MIDASERSPGEGSDIRDSALKSRPRVSLRSPGYATPSVLEALAQAKRRQLATDDEFEAALSRFDRLSSGSHITVTL